MLFCRALWVVVAHQFLHFGAHPRVTFVEFHQFHDHLSAVLPAPMRIVTAGAVALDDRPGLGIAADLPEISPELALIATYT